MEEIEVRYCPQNLRHQDFNFAWKVVLQLPRATLESNPYPIFRLIVMLTMDYSTRLYLHYHAVDMSPVGVFISLKSTPLTETKLLIRENVDDTL
jgi:hypothetical protein